MKLFSFALSTFALVTASFVCSQFGLASTYQDEAAPEKPATPTVEEFTKSMILEKGFQDFYRDEVEGKVHLRISDWDREFIFAYGLATGLGSNPVGLDRGQLGQQFVCKFRRVGKKVFLVARNLDFRALSDNPVERRSVRESFAESILWGGTVAAETGTTAVVDLTDLLLRDNHDVIGKLKSTEQGDYSLDSNRCGVYFDRCKGFPENTELEATLTFAGNKPGRLVSEVTPAPNSVTLRQHLSFIQLPDDGYRPREHHPRCASIHIGFSDYAAALSEPLQKRWIVRHRLQKADPTAEMSKAVEPIVYYVDPGAPELIRDALIEGASWWNQAFEAAGFIDAFQVKVLPDDADPMDVRYNVIQWVHRSTRGWSYGGSIVDPRTGEIIKGHVTLGSLRVRQDRLLFEALGNGRVATVTSAETQRCASAFGVIEEGTLAGLSRNTDPVEVALARIRQLSAHEVGHTLGFVHNFAASTYDDRASVMDYPAPRITVDGEGKLDMSDAYGVGIGSWDKWSVEFAYRQFNESENETEKLDALVAAAVDANMLFVSDADARPAAASHHLGNLWDNGTDPVAELEEVMKVRRLALDNLGPASLSPRETLGNMEQMFVPVFLHHRFQVDAVAKMIGGVEYSYDVAEYRKPMRVVDAQQQARAFNALLKTIEPEQLAIRDELWKHIAPKPYRDHRQVERFQGKTGPVFDRVASARIAADMTIGNILQPQRIARMSMTGSQDFSASKMVLALVDHVWGFEDGKNRQADLVSRAVKQSLVDHLVKLAASDSGSPESKAVADSGLARIWTLAESQAMKGSNEDEKAFANLVMRQMRRFENRPYPQVEPAKAIPAPPGSPIGN